MRDTARQWDSYDAYLFDIDGTLLNCTDAIHYFAFCEALTSVAGRPLNLDGVVTHGNVDVGIIRDAFVIAGVSEEQWRPQLPTIQKDMCRFVESRANDLRIVVLPGVVASLNHLRRRGAVLGVATGNLEGIGRTKLKHCGLFDKFDFGGYSDAHEYRRDVFRSAVEEDLRRRGYA
jgi:phosphoglycolate phosphatase